MARVRVICGGPRSGRAAALNTLMAEAWDHAVFLLPTRQLAARRTEELIQSRNGAGAWGRKATTFQDFLRGVLQSEFSAATGIDEFERRLLLERVLQRLAARGAIDTLGGAVTSNGFLSHMLRVISDLKQAAIEPAEFRAKAVTRRHTTGLDTVVASVYEAYQEALREANAYDTQGLYWEAHLLCERGRPRALNGVSTLLLDGFDDFTPSEFRLLTSLSPYLDTMVFGLNCDPQRPSRKDLDAIPLETLERLRNAFDAADESLEEPAPKTFTEFAAAHIFWRDTPPAPSGLTANLELQPCASGLHEIEVIGRQIKRLLLSGTPASGIAVAYRDIGQVSGELRSVFGEYGIPLAVHAQPPLIDSALSAYVLGLLDAIDTWSREAVVGALTSPWFCLANDVSSSDLAAAPYVSRAARIVGGYNEWDGRLSRMLDALNKDADPALKAFTHRFPQAHDAERAVRAIQTGLRALKAFSDRLGMSAPIEEFAKRLDSTLESSGLVGALDIAVPEQNREAERNALVALRGALGAICEWHSAGGPSEALPRSEFTARLRQTLRATPYTIPRARNGVACISTDGLRGLTFKHVFFGGVNEGDVPRPAAANAIYSDEDVEDLRAVGLHIEGRGRRSQREVRLFQQVLESAQTTLCVSWHLTNRRGGEALRSAYVADLLELFPNEGALKPVPRAADLTPDAEAAASIRELRNAVFARDTEQRNLFRNEFAPVFRGVGIELSRQRSGAFDRYDGVLSDPSRIAALARRFGAAHSFSVNQIEAYLACPFGFFMARVLDIDESEPPVAEFDDRVRGIILHAAMERFHRHYLGRSVAEIPVEEAHDTLHAIVRDVFDSRGWWSVTAPPGVIEAEKRIMLNWVSRYLRLARERSGESEWKPSHFEVAFGPEVKARQDADALSRPEAYPLETPAGTVLFSGRIDRIDLGERGARIVDYKTKYSPEQKDIREGLSLQLSLYALALEEFLAPNLVCQEAYFVPVAKTTWIEGLGKAKGNWTQCAELARQKVADSVAGIRAGQFAPMPAKDQCARCGARRPCRYEAGRVERKAKGLDGPDT